MVVQKKECTFVKITNDNLPLNLARGFSSREKGVGWGVPKS